MESMLPERGIIPDEVHTLRIPEARADDSLADVPEAASSSLLSPMSCLQVWDASLETESPPPTAEVSLKKESTWEDVDDEEQKEKEAEEKALADAKAKADAEAKAEEEELQERMEKKRREKEAEEKAAEEAKAKAEAEARAAEEDDRGLLLTPVHEPAVKYEKELDKTQHEEKKVPRTI